MDNEGIILWQNSFSVGIKLIDEQHMELVNLTNKLFASCLMDQKLSKKVFMDTIHEVVEYVSYHFGTEEKIMQRVNYPGFAEHKNEHRVFVQEVFIKAEDFKANKPFAPLTFVYFLKDWVLQHIAVCDKKMGDHIVVLKRRGAFQNLALKVKKDQATERMNVSCA